MNIKKIIGEEIRKTKSKKKFITYDRHNPGNYYSIAPFDFYKCIFIHIPKTGGISISHSLFGNTAGVHSKIKDYQKIFPEKTFTKYYKFSFVRNPWDRILSAYTYLKKGGMHKQDAEWANNHLKSFNSFESFVSNWVNEENIYKGIHFHPQSSFLKDNDGNLIYDYLGRFENINEDFHTICEKLKVNKTLLHKNSSGRKVRYQSCYNEYTANIIRDVYAEDIENFNYKF